MSSRQIRKQFDFQLSNNTVLGQQSGAVLPIPILDEDNMISDSDTSLATQQSIKAYVDLSVTGALIPQGVRDANTNTPALASSVGTLGHLYVVDVAGTTNLDGNATRGVADLLFFANGVWNRVPNTIVLTRGTIGGTLSDQTDLQAALNNKEDLVNKATNLAVSNNTLYPTTQAVNTGLNLKADNASQQTTSTTVTLTKDTRHGIPTSPITGDITVDLTGALDGPIAKIHHTSSTVPTFTNATIYSGEYDTTVQNFIQIERDGTRANVYISQANA